MQLFVWPLENKIIKVRIFVIIKEKQAGAELCQAQFKPGLAKLAVTRKKLRAYKLEVTFHSKRD